MHTAEVPAEALEGWLDEYATTKGSYGHRLLEQVGVTDGTLVNAFRPYFESAHLDARSHFHEQIGIDLHPDAEDEGVHAIYPGCLPRKAKRGLFGEVMAGMLTEHYSFVGEHEWRVPIFLFRYHADVEAYLFALARDPTRTRQVFGRFGSDFLALALDAEGYVVRYLVGEAKWRRSLTQATVDSLLLGDDGIWHQLNVDINLPHGLRQLQRLLREHDPHGWAAAIVSLDRALLVKSAVPIPRTNLVLICGNGSAKRKAREVLIDWEAKPAEYTAPHDLQVVELILSDGEQLIDEIYACLWDGV